MESSTEENQDGIKDRMQNGGKRKQNFMQSPAQRVGHGNSGKNMGRVQHKGKPGENRSWPPICRRTGTLMPGTAL